MNPLSELTRLALTYFPLFALFVLAGSLLLRFALDKVPAKAQAEQHSDVADIALTFGLLGIVLLHAVAAMYALAPSLFPPLLLGLWELLFLSAWAGLTFGASVKAFSRTQAWRAGEATQARPASYYALLALTGLSGMGMAISCRWTTTWLWQAWSSWAAVFSDTAEPGLLFVMPMAVPMCLLLLISCCVLWPASGLRWCEVFPFHSVFSRLRQGAATTSLGAKP